MPAAYEFIKFQRSRCTCGKPAENCIGYGPGHPRIPFDPDNVCLTCGEIQCNCGRPLFDSRCGYCAVGAPHSMGMHRVTVQRVTAARVMESHRAPVQG